MARPRIPPRRRDGGIVEFEVLPAPLPFVAVAGVSDALQHHPLLAVATLFGAGLLTSLSPCIYPMIPITAGLLAGRTEGGGGAAPPPPGGGFPAAHPHGVGVFL